MSNPFAGNVPLNSQQVNRLAKRPNIEAQNFSVTSVSPVTTDSGPYINNKTIQINQLTGSLTVQISLDGINFYAGPTIAAIGIYTVILPCRYIKFTAGGSCSGLVLGSL